jgi:hypothetical protein
MLCLLKLIFGVLVRSFRDRRDLLLENLALRQQLCTMARRRPQPRFSNGDRLLWVMLRRLWSGWPGPDSGPTGHRCVLASSWVQAVLEMAFAVQSPRRQKVDEQGNP